jgi:hypothetical protein
MKFPDHARRDPTEKLTFHFADIEIYGAIEAKGRIGKPEGCVWELESIEKLYLLPFQIDGTYSKSLALGAQSIA